MKTILITLLGIFILSNEVSAQKKEEISHDFLNIAYEIPEDWQYDTFSSSSVCDCPGVVVLNQDDDLFMVIYSSDIVKLHALKSYEVWGHRFATEGKNAKEFSNGHFSFSEVSGNDTFGGDKPVVFKQLVTTVGAWDFVIYIWGHKKYFTGKAEVVDELIKSLKPIDTKTKAKEKYDAIENYFGDFAVVRNKDLYGIVNYKGKLVVPVEYHKINTSKWYSNVGLLIKNAKYGAFNRKMKTIPSEFDAIERLDKGYFLVRKNKKEGIYSAKTMKPVIKVQYDEIDTKQLKSAGMVKMRKGTQWTEKRLK